METKNKLTHVRGQTAGQLTGGGAREGGMSFWGEVEFDDQINQIDNC